MLLLMTRLQRAAARALLFCLGASPLLAWPGITRADPTIDVPPAQRGVVLRCPDGSIRLAFFGELAITTILAAEETAEYPEVGLLEPASFDLTTARIGLFGGVGATRYVLRVDLAEALRDRADDDSSGEPPGATIDRFIDDAALWWQPRVWARFALGRHKVPFSRFRQLERSSLTAGAVPFVVDRLAPDRRWGASIYGDLGALAYALGTYADMDELEARRTPDPSPDPSSDPALSTDPSAGGHMLATAYVWWTPRAPIGPDHMPTPPSEPWFRTLRPAAGLGVMWRERRGGNRLDISLAVQLAYRRFAAISEVLAYSDGRTLGLGASLQASVLISDGAVLFALGDYDSQLSTWSAGGGAAFFVTRDRKNKLGLVGWARRELQGGPSRDAVLVQLQATL